ncbi:MAG: M56 family metallopeptidase, partial [Vicinamibacteria bacterium]|nr:M56 family metallopeptidase [Vicinamibacteria bacterium]
MNTLVLAIVVKASLLLGAAAVINVLLRRRTSAATRHLVWTLALGGALLLPVLSAIVPAWGIPIRFMAATPAPAAEPVADDEDSFDATTATSVMAAAPLTSASSVDAAPEGSSAPRSIPAATLALAVYLAGVGLLGLRLARGRFILSRLVRQSAAVTDPEWLALLRECEERMGVARPVRLLRSLDRNMPMAFGVRTPTVLIPAIADTWSEDRRRAVLLHELAHIDRRDCLTQLVAELTCAAYWMHPGVWFAARRLRVEREIACDDRVLSAGTAARDYAGHLLEIAYSLGGYRSPALVVSMARPRQLEGRMLAVLDAARNRVTPPRRAQVIGVVAALALVVPLAAAEAVVAPDPSLRPAMVEWAEPSVAMEAQAP